MSVGTTNYSREQVRNILSSVISKVDNSKAQPIQHIHAELSALAAAIDNMHNDILATRSHDVGDKHIPNATDELDAIIGATEEASATIMDSCEEIQAVADDLNDAAKTKIYDETTKIFEACSFQDITGQRISKVVKTLREIEDSVDKLLQLFGPADKSLVPEKIDTRGEDEKLLNGPQMAGEGVSQDDIDRLLAEFD